MLSGAGGTYASRARALAGRSTKSAKAASMRRRLRATGIIKSHRRFGPIQFCPDATAGKGRMPKRVGVIADEIFEGDGCGGVIRSVGIIRSDDARSPDRASVPEMPDAGEYHGDIVFVGGLDHLVVADRAA